MPPLKLGIGLPLWREHPDPQVDVAAVTAEDVGTEEQLEFLLAHDCDEAQGFYFSKPISLESFTKLLYLWRATPAPFHTVPTRLIRFDLTESTIDRSPVPDLVGPTPDKSIQAAPTRSDSNPYKPLILRAISEIENG